MKIYFSSLLQKNFPVSLSHLVKLELANNRLRSLPENFGLLVNLRHLDLYKNELTTLPLSFGSLRSLRWLDLNSNPLVPKMAQVAGPCANTEQCQRAAKNVVSFMSSMQQLVEEEKKKRHQQRIEQEGQSQRDAFQHCV
ncbi:hypothetical protein AAG570_004632 [Ranatra chinensis]|uniref:Leucine-rich repeat-containing protein 59 n=1 Tax=Ranatra chinensis TaxID=642074 RepID=A0ABD0Y1I4_9HEMI